MEITVPSPARPGWRIMNLLLDTNVFIDYLGGREPFYLPARRIVAAGFFGDAQLWVPAQSAKDAFYVLNHYIEGAKVQEAMLRAFEVIRPVSLAAEDAIRAAQLNWQDYEDCLVALAAERAQADYIITRDKKGFGRSSVPTMSPGEWLDMMESGKGLIYEEITL